MKYICKDSLFSYLVLLLSNILYITELYITFLLMILLTVDVVHYSYIRLCDQSQEKWA